MPRPASTTLSSTRAPSCRTETVTALGELHLQRQRRDRRAQLVRRVGEEAPLRVERALQAREQRVDLLDQRRELLRHVVGRQRIEARGVAVAHALRGVAYRPQSALE